MKVADLQQAWERLEGIRQSYQFNPFPLKDIDGSGRDTTLDRLINKYEIEWGNWLEENPSATNSPNYLDERYARVNIILTDAIKNHVTGSEGRSVSSGETIDILGKVPTPTPYSTPKPKKKLSGPLILAALIGIGGTIGIMRQKRLI